MDFLYQFKNYLIIYKMSDEEINLIAFNTIYKFIKALNDLYGQDHKPLALYNRLISKTTIAHKKPVSKHVDKFREFCEKNRQGLIERNFDKFVLYEIRYSENVYIDMKQIFNLIRKENSNQINDAVWKHLLTLSAILDPAGRAKELLKNTLKFNSSQSSETNSVPGKEVDFITNIIDKVEKNVDPNASPMDAISSMLNSGVITDLITTMNNDLQSGNMDINKLIGTVANMVGKLGGNGNNEEDINDPSINMMNTMLGSFMQNLKTGTDDDTLSGDNLNSMINLMLNNIPASEGYTESE
jgi:hypothetical protein